MTLSINQQKVLDAVKVEQCAPVRYLRRRTGLSAGTVNRALTALEARGLVMRTFNAWGPQTPWWWQPAKPSEGLPIPQIRPQTIWDWGRREDRLWLQVARAPDENGMVLCDVRAGEHNTVRCPLPAHLFARHMDERVRGDVTAWSSQFACPVHGECTEDMVRTDKTCALCGSLLNRLGR